MAKFPRDVERELQSILRDVRASTVKVKLDRHGSGSGVIWDDRGRVVSNAHVAHDSMVKIELPGGQEVPGEVVRRDRGMDLAEIQLERGYSKPIAIREGESPAPGELVMSLGNPWGGQTATSLGIVHSASQCLPDSPVRLVQADLRLAPGFSGGPMVDMRGRLVGINTMIAGSLGVAIHVESVRRFLARLEKAQLGIAVIPVTTAMAQGFERGLAVTEVISQGPADRAGLLVGDILVRVAGQVVRDSSELRAALTVRGAAVGVEFIRGDKPVTMHISFNESGIPAARAA